MSRKDYIVLAKAIAKLPRPSDRGVMAADIAAHCKASNAKFDLVKFYKACNVAYKIVGQNGTPQLG
jgi:hypothetical protein